MDRKRALELLRGGSEGIALWNDWRSRGQPSVRLSYSNLADLDLSVADLAGVNLRASNFRRTKLVGAQLTGADLRRCNFRSADLTRAVLCSADLRAANLRDARLAGADLRQARLRRASFAGATADARTLWPGDLAPRTFRSTAARSNREGRTENDPPPALANDIAGPLLEFLRRQFGSCVYAEPLSPLRRGNEAIVYTFRVAGLRPPLDRPLVLRLFRSGSDPQQVLAQSAIQDAIAEQSFPAPKVYATDAGDDALGGPFLLMERLPGEPLYGDILDVDERGVPRAKPGRLVRRGIEMLMGLPRRVAELELRLHELRTAPVMAALDRAGVPWWGLTPAGRLTWAGSQIDVHGLEGLRPGLDWLWQNLPNMPDELVVCHGDLHPLNLLIREGEVSGVLDWSMTALAPREFEIGWMRATYLTIPLPLPGPLRFAERAIAAHLARRFSTSYARRRPIDGAVLPYYEAFRSLVGLTSLGARVARGEAIRDAWNSPQAIARVLEHFLRLTGIEAAVPRLCFPRPRSPGRLAPSSFS